MFDANTLDSGSEVRTMGNLLVTRLHNPNLSHNTVPVRSDHLDHEVRRI